MKIHAISAATTLERTLFLGASRGVAEAGAANRGGDILEISGAARLLAGGSQTGNDNLDLLVNRLKSSPLSFGKKEMVLKMAWTMARTGMIEGGASRAELSPEDLRRFLELIAVMEQVELQKTAYSGMLRDADRIDRLVEGLRAEDRRIIAAQKAAAPLENIELSGQSDTNTAK